MSLSHGASRPPALRAGWAADRVTMRLLVHYRQVAWPLAGAYQTPLSFWLRINIELFFYNVRQRQEVA
jgi:hypothetical protein